jgi:hypothetical protein
MTPIKIGGRYIVKDVARRNDLYFNDFIIIRRHSSTTVWCYELSRNIDDSDLTDEYIQKNCILVDELSKLEKIVCGVE